jgi:integrase
MDFPARLPDVLRRRLPPGVSLFPRPEKRRWVISCAPEWRQKVLPAVVVTCDDAIAWVRAHLAETGQDPGAAMTRVRVSGPIVDECADKWLLLLEADERCAPASLKLHRGYLKNWIRPRWGKVALAELDVPPLRAWLRELRAGTAVHAPGAEDRLGGRSIHHMHSTFGLLYDAALAEGWLRAHSAMRSGDAWMLRAANILRHPGVRAELPIVKDADPVRVPIPTVQKLLDAPAVELEQRARYALAFTSGMRDGEIAGVQLERLARDGSPPTVQIIEAVALVGAKGPGGFARPKAPKTRSSVRTLPLHPCADSAIAEWVSVGLPRLLGRDVRPGDYLFPRPDGAPSRPRSAEQLRADLRAAGLPDHVDGEPVGIKSARSSFLTWLDELGVDERVRKRLAGHRPNDVTEAHYTKRELEQLAAAVGKIPLVWTRGVGTVTPPVPAGTVNAKSPSDFGAPETTRTSDQRFRKSMHAAASCGSFAQEAATACDIRLCAAVEAGPTVASWALFLWPLWQPGASPLARHTRGIVATAAASVSISRTV